MGDGPPEEEFAALTGIDIIVSARAPVSAHFTHLTALAHLHLHMEEDPHQARAAVMRESFFQMRQAQAVAVQERLFLTPRMSDQR